MKKLLFIAVLAVISTASFAQISWNVKAGVNMSNLNGIKDSDLKMKFGYQLGVGMEYTIDEMFSVQPSLLFITKGAKASNDYAEASDNPMYLKLPVMGAARFNVSEGMNVVLNAGPYFAYGIGGKSKYKDKEGDEPEEKEDLFGDKGSYKRFDFGLGIGAALEIEQFIISLDGSFGLTNIAKNSGDGYSPKNMTFGLSLGYKF